MTKGPPSKSDIERLKRAMSLSEQEALSGIAEIRKRIEAGEDPKLEYVQLLDHLTKHHSAVVAGAAEQLILEQVMDPPENG